MADEMTDEMRMTKDRQYKNKIHSQTPQLMREGGGGKERHRLRRKIQAMTNHTQTHTRNEVAR